MDEDPEEDSNFIFPEMVALSQLIDDEPLEDSMLIELRVVFGISELRFILPEEILPSM
jgi:hypothetical protein